MPGLRPIGVGETLRRVLGKCVSNITGEDLEGVFGIEQLAGGLEGGIEGSIHGLRELNESQKDNGFALMLVDAKNAINAGNRKLLLLNARREWTRA